MFTAIEFYSGIGGTHFALKECSSNVQVIAAFDINTTANQIYAQNFANTKLCQNNIQGISVEQLDKWNADLWTMSPPCQPYTTKGLKLAEEDRRSDSFFTLLDRLEAMKARPRGIFVENVVGFESSTPHNILVELLNKLGYEIKEYILSPIQFGIPNTRPRYYLFATNTGPSPENYYSDVLLTHNRCIDIVEPISNFLCEDADQDKSLFVDAKLVEKHGIGMDVVTTASIRSGCFTKSYGTFVTGCGSYFALDDSIVSTEPANRLTADAVTDPGETAKKLRRFSPREVASLMSFPSEFRIPATSTQKQMYRTLGNSVNVRVVSVLLEDLLDGIRNRSS